MMLSARPRDCALTLSLGSSSSTSSNSSSSSRGKKGVVPSSNKNDAGGRYEGGEGTREGDQEWSRGPTWWRRQGRKRGGRVRRTRGRRGASLFFFFGHPENVSMCIHRSRRQHCYLAWESGREGRQKTPTRVSFVGFLMGEYAFFVVVPDRPARCRASSCPRPPAPGVGAVN